MAGRRRAREYALAALYAIDVGGLRPNDALEGVWQLTLEADPPEVPPTADEQDFAALVVRGVSAEQVAIDKQVEAASVNWRLGRMPAVDRNILRLGTWELSRRKDIPASVSINEAIELAKRFGAADTRAFVNGILDRIATELGRGGRRSNKSA